MRMLSSVAPRTIAVQTGSVPTDSRPLRRQYRTIHKKNQMRELKQIIPPSADMGRIANIGLRTPPWQYTITPNSNTVRELLRKAAPRRPGTGMVIRIRHLSEEHGLPLDTHRPSKGSLSHTLYRLGL
jgi:hypothetical protein